LVDGHYLVSLSPFLIIVWYLIFIKLYILIT
jgi:hypothetical protein